MSLINETLKDFLEKVAEKTPTPGGGSVAALAGAISSALLEMVCNLTIGKEKYKEFEEEMKIEREKCRNYREKFINLIDEDSKAFDEVISAFKLPKDYGGRKEAIQNAYKKACAVPLETAEYCIKLMESGIKIAEKGNKNSISDAGVASLMAKSAFHSAILNVKINLSGIKDSDYVQKTKNHIKKMEYEAENLHRKIMEVVERWL
ncbi:MAG TPA: methenyltetrahydrofolate cyclohydrolase [Thermoplasmata archaeon]|nr:methenyltetrahydrofolate cyclohydrolase [Thermoplasmata archaeon]